MKRILFILFILPEIFLPKLSHASITCGVDRIPVAGCIYRNDNNPTYSFISITDGMKAEVTDKEYANPIKSECVKSQGGFMGIGSAKPSLKNSYFWAHEDELQINPHMRYDGIKERRTVFQRSFNVRRTSYEDHRKLDLSLEKEVKLTEGCRLNLGLRWD